MTSGSGLFFAALLLTFGLVFVGVPLLIALFQYAPFMLVIVLIAIVLLFIFMVSGKGESN